MVYRDLGVLSMVAMEKRDFFCVCFFITTWAQTECPEFGAPLLDSVSLICKIKTVGKPNCQLFIKVLWDSPLVYLFRNWRRFEGWCTSGSQSLKLGQVLWRFLDLESCFLADPILM